METKKPLAPTHQRREKGLLTLFIAALWLCCTPVWSQMIITKDVKDPEHPGKISGGKTLPDFRFGMGNYGLVARKQIISAKTIHTTLNSVASQIEAQFDPADLASENSPLASEIVEEVMAFSNSVVSGGNLIPANLSNGGTFGGGGYQVEGGTVSGDSLILIGDSSTLFFFYSDGPMKISSLVVRGAGINPNNVFWYSSNDLAVFSESVIGNLISRENILFSEVTTYANAAFAGQRIKNESANLNVIFKVTGELDNCIPEGLNLLCNSSFNDYNATNFIMLLGGVGWTRRWFATNLTNNSPDLFTKPIGFTRSFPFWNGVVELHPNATTPMEYEQFWTSNYMVPDFSIFSPANVEGGDPDAYLKDVSGNLYTQPAPVKERRKHGRESFIGIGGNRNANVGFSESFSQRLLNNLVGEITPRVFIGTIYARAASGMASVNPTINMVLPNATPNYGDFAQALPDDANGLENLRDVNSWHRIVSFFTLPQGQVVDRVRVENVEPTTMIPQPVNYPPTPGWPSWNNPDNDNNSYVYVDDVTLHEVPNQITLQPCHQVYSGQSFDLALSFLNQEQQDLFFNDFGATWQWFRVTGSTQQLEAEGESASANLVAPVVSTTTVVTYNLFITVNGLTQFVNSINVTVKPIPAPQIVTSGSLCTGTSLTLTATNTSGITFVSWSGPSGSSLVNVAQGGLQAVFNPVISGDYIFTYYVECLGNVSLVRHIDVFPIPTVTLTAGKNPVCLGESTTLTGTSAPAFSWSPSLSGNPVVVQPTATTTYTYSISDEHNCPGQASLTLVVVAPFSANISISGGGVNVCSNEPFVRTLAAPQGNYTYTWTPGSFHTQSIDVTAAGTYAVHLEDPNGCKADDQITIVGHEPSLTLEPRPCTGAFVPEGYLPSVCDNYGKTYWGFSPDYTDYHWSNSANLELVEDASNPLFAYVNSIVGSAPTTGTITLTIDDQWGCHASQTLTVPVFHDPLPDFTITSNIFSCGYSTGTVYFTPTDPTLNILGTGSCLPGEIGYWFTMRNINDPNPFGNNAGTSVQISTNPGQIFLVTLWNPCGVGVTRGFSVVQNSNGTCGISVSTGTQIDYIPWGTVWGQNRPGSLSIELPEKTNFPATLYVTDENEKVLKTLVAVQRRITLSTQDLDKGNYSLNDQAGSKGDILRFHVGDAVEQKNIVPLQSSLLPNPSNSDCHLTFEKRISQLEVVISDMLGKQVFKTQEFETKEIHIPSSGFATGVYTVHAVADGVSQVVKLIRE